MKILLTLLLIAGSLSVNESVFPSISCTNLKDEVIQLPSAISGKRTVIAMMLSLKADKMMQKWNQPLYRALLADGAGGMMGGNMYNANLYFVGVVKGLQKLALPEIIKKAKKEVDVKYHPFFMYTNAEIDLLIKAIDIKNVDEPQFIVLETDGKILYKTSGEYSDDKLNDITGSLLN